MMMMMIRWWWWQLYTLHTVHVQYRCLMAISINQLVDYHKSWLLIDSLSPCETPWRILDLVRILQGQDPSRILKDFLKILPGSWKEIILQSSLRRINQRYNTDKNATYLPFFLFKSTTPTRHHDHQHTKPYSMPSDVLYTHLYTLVCQNKNRVGGPITYQIIILLLLMVYWW